MQVTDLAQSRTQLNGSSRLWIALSSGLHAIASRVLTAKHLFPNYNGRPKAESIGRGLYRTVAQASKHGRLEGFDLQSRHSGSLPNCVIGDSKSAVAGRRTSGWFAIEASIKSQPLFLYIAPKCHEAQSPGDSTETSFML